MSKLSYLLVLLSLVTSNIYTVDSYTLTASVLNQLGYNTQSMSIFITDNSIDSIDSNALNGFDKLTSFNINSEGVTSLDLEIFKGAVNINLIWLQLKSLNKLTNSRNVKLPSLRSLYLSTNLTSLNKALFNAFPSLTFFSTGYFGYFSTLKTIDVHAFESLSNLTSLDLRYNLITAFEYLQIPKNLEAISLSWNSMNYFALSRTMGVLKSLDISNNRFRSFKSMDFTFLANLTYLDLSDNPHAYPNEISGHLKPLVNLNNVNLANLSISSIDSNFFKFNTKIMHVFLSRNKISRVENGSFIGLTDLITIALDSNNLTKIESGAFQFSSINYAYLHRVDLRNNQISQIDELSFIASGMQLQLSYNRLTKLSKAFRGMFALIDLSYNQITEIDNLTFAGVNQIDTLDLSSNKIEKIAPDTFNTATLITVYLSNNNLTELDNMTFAGQRYLKTIYLSNNKLSTIETGSFANFFSLQYVYLDGNQLTQLDSSIFTGSNNLQGIYLTGNPNLSTANIQNLCPPAATYCQVYY